MEAMPARKGWENENKKGSAGKNKDKKTRGRETRAGKRKGRKRKGQHQGTTPETTPERTPETTPVEHNKGWGSEGQWRGKARAGK